MTDWQNNRGDMAAQEVKDFRPFDARASDQPRAASQLDLLSELRDRIAAVEASQASIHKKIDDATKAGTLDPALLEKTAHVMTKYFPHDFPEKEPEAPPRPKFDPFTGQPLQ